MAQSFNLNEEQLAAMVQMMAWVDTRALTLDDLFFLFKSPAGCGKTYTTQALLAQLKGRVVFTAPTNKATKVLRETLTTKEYKPECRTIYSLLGLSLQPNGEVKELSVPEDPVDLSTYKLVVVDEGFMLNSMVWSHLQEAAQEFNLKFLILGDDCQLPPVKEDKSPVADIKNVATLTKVMRHDNQILTLAMATRAKVGNPAASFGDVKSSNDDKGGVWVLNAKQFQDVIADRALLGEFHTGQSKIIAWRNVTVDKWNKFVRVKTYSADVVHTHPWLVGDRVIFTSPAKDLDDEVKATTDDEGVVQSAVIDDHPLYAEFKVWRISVVMDDNRIVIARVLHQDYLGMFNRKAEQYASEAKANSKKWRHFWDFKDAFHNLRHAYAITVHRAQGSTYETAFVEYKDILINPNRQEAVRCFYTAGTRPKKELYLA